MTSIIVLVLTLYCTVRIQHRYELEDKVFPCYDSSLVNGTKQKLKKTVKNMAGRTLSRMYSAAHKYHLIDIYSIDII